MKVYLENVRTFVKPQGLQLRPLTVLLGENSTGKSTFLAVLAYLSRIGFPGLRPNFNVPPFDLGTYDSIATYKGGRYGRSSQFSIGYLEEEGQRRKFDATFRNHKGQPQLSKLSVSGGPGDLSLELSDDLSGTLKLVTPTGERYEIHLALNTGIETGLLVSLLNALSTTAPNATSPPVPSQVMLMALNILSPQYLPLIALAPIRTRPRRTYDELSDEFKPEGDHVPVMLARIWEEENSTQKSRLIDALETYGKDASLYQKIGVRRLGSRPTDPFQLLITTAGPPVNIPDVGYGVSQALPLVAQCVLAPQNGRLLIQQPEVHLHPRGQAALGSFFARTVAKERKKLVIETHSDYLVDRMRLEVAKGTLAAKDLVFLFFEKKGMETQVHQITVDDGGNVLNAPDSYRKFFFEEELDLLSRVKS